MHRFCKSIIRLTNLGKGFCYTEPQLFLAYTGLIMRIDQRALDQLRGSIGIDRKDIEKVFTGRTGFVE